MTNFCALCGDPLDRKDGVLTTAHGAMHKRCPRGIGEIFASLRERVAALERLQRDVSFALQERVNHLELIAGIGKHVAGGADVTTADRAEYKTAPYGDAKEEDYTGYCRPQFTGPLANTPLVQCNYCNLLIRVEDIVTSGWTIHLIALPNKYEMRCPAHKDGWKRAGDCEGDGWNRFPETKPEFYDSVLVVSNGTVKFAHMDGIGIFRCLDRVLMYPVTHWRPLPPAPKE